MNEPLNMREALIAEMLGDIYKTYLKLEAINKELDSTTKRFLDASQAYQGNARKAVQTLTAHSANQVFNDLLLPNFKTELKTFIDNELREFTKQLKNQSTSFEKSELHSVGDKVFFWVFFAVVSASSSTFGVFLYLNLFAK